MAQVYDIKWLEDNKLFQIDLIYTNGKTFFLYLPSHEAQIGDIIPVTRAMLTGEVNGIKWPWLRGKEC